MPQRPARCPPSKASTTRASSTTRAASSFVADLHGRAQPPHGASSACSSLCNLDHRGATNAEANVGDGAGILIQVPDRFLREVVGLRPARRPAPTPPASAFLPRDAEAEAAATAGIEKIAAERGPAGPRLARRARRQLDDRPAGRRRRAVVPAGVPHRRRGPAAARRASTSTGAASSCASAWSTSSSTGGERGVLPEPLGPHPRLQGHAHLATRSATFFPDLRDERRRVAPRPRALPLLHQHVPVVAARPPVPVRRPQRRDQHGDGQRELDAGPRGAARDRPASTASTGPSRSARPAAPTPPASTRSSSCCTSAATRSPTPC